MLLSFFFNARGADLEKSVNGLYRSLIVQVLKQHAKSDDHWVDRFPDAQPLNDRFLSNPARLKDLLRQALKLIGQQDIVIVVDALDEGEEDEIREMITFLEQLGTEAISASRSLYTLFSSRYYPHITLKRAVELRVEKQQGHTEDIRKYINQQLHMADSKETRALQQAIQGKASSVFIWVVLVVHILNKAYDQGQIHQLRKRLELIPEDLNDLFRDILARDRENMGQTVLCIQWVLFARYPLHPKELYFAILSGTEPDALYVLNSEIVTTDTIHRFILNASKGLVEMTTTNYPVAQFIHESVRDFLKDGGLRDLLSCLPGEVRGLVHNSLKRSCLNYIDSEILDRAIEDQAQNPKTFESVQALHKKFPFLKYSIENVLFHANQAQSNGQSQKKSLGDFPLRRWAGLKNMVSLSNVQVHPIDINLLYILAEDNHAHLIRLIVRDHLGQRQYGRNFGNPIFAAIASNSQEAFRELLHAEKEECPNGRDFPYPNLRPFLFLGSNASSALTARCLAYYHFDSELRDQSQSHWLLRRIAAAGHAEGVLALIKKGIDVGIVGPFGTALEAAAGSGHEHVVQLLLKSGAQANYARTNALAVAAKNGHDRTVRILLAAGADIDSREGNIGAALYAASSSGQVEVVKLLLVSGAVANTIDPKLGTALHIACYKGHTSVVETLLSHGAAIDVRNPQHGTDLQVACQLGHFDIAKLLLAHGVNVDSVPELYGTALQAAQSRERPTQSKSRQDGLVRLLSDAGVL